jgi:tetratricopeptide (TPR) repeat protein
MCAAASRICLLVILRRLNTIRLGGDAPVPGQLRYAVWQKGLVNSAFKMATYDDFATAIRKRDIQSIAALMFEGSTATSAMPSLRMGFFTENELWDFKAGCPAPGKAHLASWSEIAVDVLAFHNASGGVIVFGVDDKYSPIGTSHHIDSKLFNDQIRRFLSDRIWVEFHRAFIQSDQRYIGFALIPPRGPVLEKFQSEAPLVSGKRRFSRGDSALRENDSSRVLTSSEAATYARILAVPTLGTPYAVDEPFFRILNPEYPTFILRSDPCNEVLLSLADKRTAITSIIGGGGSGKTALATWAALKVFDERQFNFIVSLTAKDRELTASGIQALNPGITTFEALLNNILDVLQFPELKINDLASKEASVRQLLTESNGLLFVDNLETVDDARIIQFLDSLPIGVRALTTSRRMSVRVAVRPVTLGGLTGKETIAYVRSLSSHRGLQFISDFSDAEIDRLGASCDGLPLAIKWTLSQCKNAGEALAHAERVVVSGTHDEELLEFCFRRVFDAMSGAEKSVLFVLSMFQRPLNTEALLVGSTLPQSKLVDATEDLISDSIIQRLFDSEQNDYSFMLLPITRSFVKSEMNKEPGLEDKLRSRLSDYYEARDVADPKERVVVREIRQGKSGADAALVDLAMGAQRRGDFESAKSLFQQALARNPRSWNAARMFAEFFRHSEPNAGEALRLYEVAARNAPSRGPERSLIFREWGMILRDSGDPEATERAIQCFEMAILENRNDVLAIHALAVMLARKSAFKRVIELLEPLRDHHNQKTREFAASLLLLAYTRTGALLEASGLRAAGVKPWSL